MHGAVTLDQDGPVSIPGRGAGRVSSGDATGRTQHHEGKPMVNHGIRRPFKGFHLGEGPCDCLFFNGEDGRIGDEQTFGGNCHTGSIA